jgi:LDH2 family malate/lactate/ureidoglycolate dehydrogenase
MPGDEAARVRAENQAEGIPLSDSLARELHGLAEELGVESPFAKAETR